jgi:hypothetical protein
LNDTTNGEKQWFYSRRQKKRKSQGGNRDGQDRREDRSAAIIRHISYAYNQDGRPVIIKHIGASMGYDWNDMHQHTTSCAIVMGLHCWQPDQPASITKTGEACPRASADFIPASLIAAGEALLRASADIPVSTTKTGGACLCASAEIPALYNAT